MWLALAALGAIIWLLVFILPWKPWATKEQLEANSNLNDQDLDEVTILTPARNEEGAIGTTIQSVKDQSPDQKMIVINDQSTDATVAEAQAIGLAHLKIIEGRELEAGWSGKLWALEQGRQHIQTPYVLLLDADIKLEPGILKTLLHKMKREDLGYVSLMAKLRLETFWEKLLIPAYIYFFKLLYPFRLANGRNRNFAAAAGGCVLTRRDILEEIGGFGALREALIDDCSLAALIKSYGYRGFVGLTHSVTSHRAYDKFAELWMLVARTAYTYLRYSSILLILCSILMLSAFLILPVMWVYALNTQAEHWSIFLTAGVAAMLICYTPTVLYYRLSPVWILSLPLAGLLYWAMTVGSAIRYYRGTRSQWKGRSYDKKLAA